MAAECVPQFSLADVETGALGVAWQQSGDGSGAALRIPVVTERTRLQS